MIRTRMATLALALAFMLLPGRTSAQLSPDAPTRDAVTRSGAGGPGAPAPPAADRVASAGQGRASLDRSPSIILSPSSVATPLLLSTTTRSRAGFEPSPAPSLPMFQERDRSGIPFMVAGGALFVSGAIVGDDGGTLLMVGGAGIGAYGLFVYFGGEPE